MRWIVSVDDSLQSKIQGTGEVGDTTGEVDVKTFIVDTSSEELDVSEEEPVIDAVVSYSEVSG